MHHEIEREIFGRLGITVTPTEHSTFTGMAGDRMWVILKERYGYLQSLDEVRVLVRRLFYDRFDDRNGGITLVEGVDGLIEKFRMSGLRLAVASSSSSAYVRMMLHHFGLASKFDRLCGGDTVIHAKPEPDLFLYAAEQVGVDPVKCLVIEDSANGVRAAKKAGMTVIGYRNLNSGEQDLSPADFIVDNYLNFPYIETM